MIANAQSYEFTGVNGVVLSGADSSACMFPSLERLAWVNEAVRTAEIRGGYVPRARGAAYTVGKGQPDALAGMFPRDLSDYYARMNAVCGVGWYVRDQVPAGEYSQFRRQVDVNPGPGNPWDYVTLAQLEQAIAAARHNPQAFNFVGPGCFADQRNVATFASASMRASRDVGGDMVRRSNIITANALSDICSAYNESWMSSDGRTVAPESGAPSTDPGLVPFRLGSGSGHRASCYYRLKTDQHDIDYWKIGEYDYSMPVTPWLYSGGALDRSMSSFVAITIFWYVTHSAIWKTSDSAIYQYFIDQKSNVRFAVSTNRGIVAQRVSSTRTTIAFDPAGVPAQDWGRDVANVVGTARLPSTAPSTSWPELHYSPVGYQVYVEPAYAIMTATPAIRNIGN